MLCFKDLGLKLSLLLNRRLGKSLKVQVVLKKLKQFLLIPLALQSYFLLKENFISIKENVTILFESSTRIFLQCYIFFLTEHLPDIIQKATKVKEVKES